MPETYRDPAVLAKNKELHKFRHVEMLIRVGATDRAEKYWRSHWPALPYPDSLKRALGLEVTPAAVPAPVAEKVQSTQAVVAMEQAPATEPVPPLVEKSPSGWPLKTKGEIIRKCGSRRLVIVRIEDGRTASMWNTGPRPWRIGAKVQVKLEKAEGDPIYRYY